MLHTNSFANESFSQALPPAVSSSSASPKFNILDFPVAAVTATRDTSYASQSVIDDLDFARSEQSTPANKYRSGIKSALFGKKLLSGAMTTTTLPNGPSQSYPAESTPPTSARSFTNFITSSNISSASRASTRAQTTSKVIFDNFFTGDSAPIDLGPTSLRSRSPSTRSVVDRGYECDSETMETSYTKAPARLRPRRSPTGESAVSKLGSWFTAANTTTSKPRTTMVPSHLAAEDDDPLLAINIQHQLFPHGPVDPLDPASFNNLLSTAESVIMTMQNAYRQQFTELTTLRSELALKDEEMEECETRAQHLKMQLQDLGEQCTAQIERAGMLESMLREKCDGEDSNSDHGCESGSVVVGVGDSSDSGFESDGDILILKARHAGPRLDQVKVGRCRNSMLPSQPTYSSNLSFENEMLRVRVAEMEGAIEGCLDMISGPWALRR